MVIIVIMVLMVIMVIMVIVVIIIIMVIMVIIVKKFIIYTSVSSRTELLSELIMTLYHRE